MNNLKSLGFPEILLEENRIDKLNLMSSYVLDYYGFLDLKTELRAKVTTFRDEVLAKDTDPINVKFSVNKTNLNDILRFLQINLLDFLGNVYTMNVVTDDQSMPQESQNEEDVIEEAKSSQTDEANKDYPVYSYKIIPILVLSTASLINEVNEKAKHFIKGFEKHSDMDQTSVEARSEQQAEESSSESDVVRPSSGMNAASVWTEIMKYYLQIVKNSMQQNLSRFDDNTKKTVLLFARNLKRNVLEYALK